MRGHKDDVSVAVPGFPRGGGANLQGGGAHLLFGQKFPENCIKMKEFGPGGRVPCAPLRSANVYNASTMFKCKQL